ncbi:hypothetical protein JCM6882_007643 [Rhodosporidiobolus microsporus]
MRLFRRGLVPALLVAVLAASLVVAEDEDSKAGDASGDNSTTTATEEPTSTDSAMPTLSEEPSSIPAQCAGLRACAALEGSDVGEQATATGGDASSTSTETATAAWATKTSGGMEVSSDEDNTVVLHTDSSISYSCPTKGDEWTTESLTDSLTAHTATGAGCTMSYTFTGDQIQVYGASGKDAGVFGCEVDLTKDLNKTGWWNAYGVTDTFRPYQGSCRMQGLGYDKHTIKLINSPNGSPLTSSYLSDEPQKVYFTGLRYTTNESQNSVWEDTKWEACCGSYTFPDGAPTTVTTAPSSTSTKSGGSTIGGLSNQSFVFVMIVLCVGIILASLLIGCLCCRKRPATTPASSTSKLAEALRDDGSASRPLRRKRHSRNDDTPSDTDNESYTEEDTEEDTEDEKPRRRKGKRR